MVLRLSTSFKNFLVLHLRFAPVSSWIMCNQPERYWCCEWLEWDLRLSTDRISMLKLERLWNIQHRHFFGYCWTSWWRIDSWCIDFELGAQELKDAQERFWNWLNHSLSVLCDPPHSWDMGDDRQCDEHQYHCFGTSFFYFSGAKVTRISRQLYVFVSWRPLPCTSDSTGDLVSLWSEA